MEGGCAVIVTSAEAQAEGHLSRPVRNDRAGRRSEVL